MKKSTIIERMKKNTKLNIIFKALAAIILITAIAALSSHYLTGPTLSDYARNNPELAYYNRSSASDTDVPDSKTSSDAEPQGSDEDTDLSGTDTTSTDNSLSSESQNPSASSDPDALHISDKVHFYESVLSTEPVSDSNGRTVIKSGFYYEPLSNDVIDYITGTSFPTDNVDMAITYDDLRYVGILYRDFDGVTQAGELICNAAIANDLAEIFSELYDADYRIGKVVLVDNYGGDDTASMEDNNTSCFNYRNVDDSASLSNHALGRAIDINPFYNPYIIFGGNEDGTDYISPSGSEIYADRGSSFPYKINENDLCYRLFIERGFTWGGNWNSCKDYQHFQKKD